jgi:homoserine dehydrogenase
MSIELGKPLEILRNFYPKPRKYKLLDRKNMELLRVGICGAGNVGGAVIKLIKESSDLLLQQGGVSIELIQVGARKGRAVVPYEDLDVTSDLMEVANNPNIDVFVELIGGTELALELIKTAIGNGKHVVTANKALLAIHGNTIFELAREKEVQVGFEASVAGGTPVIKALREGLVANKIEWFAGILNGTSNYILSEMSNENTEFSVALNKAQELGLAEADPTLDIDGTDAAQKASILAALAFHIPFDSSKVDYGGIDAVDLEDLKYAEELGYSIKHIAYGSLLGEEVSISAYPTLVSHDTLLSQVGQEMNAVEIFAQGIGSTVYYGPGAGPEPTASAVIADLVDVAKGSWHGSSIGLSKNTAGSKNLKHMSRYLRMKANNEPGAIANISSVFAKNNISIEALIQHESKPKSNEELGSVPVVILSGPITDNVAEELRISIENMTEVSGRVKQFRIHTKID